MSGNAVDLFAGVNVAPPSAAGQLLSATGSGTAAWAAAPGAAAQFYASTGAGAAAWSARGGAAAPASFTPANPAATASVTLVMMGLGATVTYTPVLTGTVLVLATGYVSTAVAVVPLTIGGRFGTGTAPVNGAAVTGTRFGPAADVTTQALAIGVPGDITLSQVLTGLALGTAVWFDFALLTSVGLDAAAVTGCQFQVLELH